MASYPCRNPTENPKCRGTACRRAGLCLSCAMQASHASRRAGRAGKAAGAPVAAPAPPVRQTLAQPPDAVVYGFAQRVATALLNEIVRRLQPRN